MDTTNSNNEDKAIVQRLQNIRYKYAESFTVHGLDHIITGKIPEKIFWSVLLLGALLGTVLMTHGLFVNYLNHEVMSKIIIKQNLKINAPTIYICGNDMQDNLGSHSNCSSSSSNSYDPVTCPSMKRKCPKFAANMQFDYSCPEELHGQCIALNANGTVVHSVDNPWIDYELGELAEEHFPLHMNIVSPGEKNVLIPVIYNKNYELIPRPGSYWIYLKKITLIKLPPPYTNCIEGKGASKNMFLGPYTITKCLTTCRLKLKWQRCNTTIWVARGMMRDVNFVRNDRSREEIEECLDTTMLDHDEYEECFNDCRQPCFEEIYEARVQSPVLKPNTSKNLTTIAFDLNAKETLLVDEPKETLIILMSAFGGTLGLLAGVSVLSVVELGIWTILFVLEKFTQYYTRKVRPLQVKALQVKASAVVEE